MLLKILSETPVHLILYAGFDDAGMIFLINKKIKEWGSNYFDMDEFKKHTPSSNSFGKCILMD